MEYDIRHLELNDLYNGFLETLDNLRIPESIKSNVELDSKLAEKAFSEINSNPDYTIYIAVDKNGFVFSTVTLIIEKKFIRECGLVGHIEDVATHKEFQGNGASTRILKKMVEIAASKGCYKTILNCEKELVGFYEKRGFREVGKEMRYDHHT